MKHDLLGQNRFFHTTGFLVLFLLVALTVELVHVGLGSSPITPAIALVALTATVMALRKLGPLNMAAVLVLLVCIRYVGFPLIGKIFVGQPLDSNLNNPDLAFFVSAVGILGYVGALGVTAIAGVGRPILTPIHNPRALTHLSIVAYLIGFVANFDASVGAYSGGSGIAISGFFVGTMHLALISALAAQIITNRRSIFNRWIVFILVTQVAFAVALNSRTPLYEALLCIVLCALAFRAAPTKSTVLYILAGALIASAASPIFLAARNTRDGSTVEGRLKATLEYALSLGDAAAASDDADYGLLVLNPSAFLLRYYGEPTKIFERLSHVNHVDVFVNATDSAGQIGAEVIERAIETTLPRFLSPDKKTDSSEGDWFYCELGIHCVDGGFGTAALIAASYVAFGWLGVAVLPMGFAASILLILKKGCGLDVSQNVWAIFMLVIVNNSFVESGISGYLVLGLRQIPQYIVLLAILSLVVRDSGPVLADAGRRMG
jgi:hypothetical protein